VKISDIPVPNKRVMGKLAQDCIDVIQGDASKGKFQNGRSGFQYSNKGAKVGFRTIIVNGKKRVVNIDSYKNRKASGMRYSNGQRVKGFEKKATNTQTAYVDMNLTKRTLRSMRASSNKKNAIITYDRGEIVLGNQKRGYDIYGLSDKNQEFIADRFGKELLDKNIKKYVSKTTIIK
tara:strand:+ start:710 stop:1240 length:531 start_codon:yes stop_codon:yes gene_type:complete